MFQDRPIDGHIRFSFYGFADTRAGPDDDGVALARLCDETRMARRFFRFGSLTPPSLIHQTDRAFRTVLMSADVMPDRGPTRPRGCRWSGSIFSRPRAEEFPWIDRKTLDGLRVRCDAVKSLADLPPVG